MKTQLIICSACLLIGALAPAAFAQQARAATGRVVIARPTGSYLGIGVADIDAERAKELKLSEVRGVEVKSLEEDGPAAKAGIKEGDVILEYNGQRIEGTEQLVRMVRETPAGREVKLQIGRAGATQTVTASIGARTARSITWSNGGSIEIPMPPMPPIPAIPDLPRGTISWRSTTLGIESESLTSQLAEFFGVKEGVLVRSTMKNSPAEKAGMKAGDVIVKVDGTSVTTPREISSTLRAARSKKTIPVVVIRDRKEMTLSVTIEDGSRYRGDRPAASRTRNC